MSSSLPQARAERNAQRLRITKLINQKLSQKPKVGSDFCGEPQSLPIAVPCDQQLSVLYHIIDNPFLLFWRWILYYYDQLRRWRLLQISILIQLRDRASYLSVDIFLGGGLHFKQIEVITQHRG